MKEGEDFEFKQHLKLFNQTISGQFIKCITASVYKSIEIIITKLIVQLWDMIIKILLKSMWNRCQLCTKALVSSVRVGRTKSIFLNWSHETLTQYMYYNVDTMKPAENIQNDEGFFDLGKITFKLTGKLPKICHKSSNKSQRKKCRKCWKQNRSAYRSKICDKFNTRKGEKIHDTPKKVGIRDTPKEDKGEELIKLLETQTETKNNTTKRVSKKIFSVVTTGLLIF